MMRRVNRTLLRWLGWRTIGQPPAHLAHYILVVAPHTSNWDFIIGLMVRSSMGLGDVRYLAKKDLFRPPFGWLFRALGGYPVDRSKHSNMTDSVVELFRTIPGFKIVITPEGTRKYVAEWKTGFHRIAKKGGIPVVPCVFDYASKTVSFLSVFPLTDDVGADIKRLKSLYLSARGLNPEDGVH